MKKLWNFILQWLPFLTSIGTALSSLVMLIGMEVFPQLYTLLYISLIISQVVGIISILVVTIINKKKQEDKYNDRK